MPLKITDVNLKYFLEKFTWLGDPLKEARLEMDLELFVQIAAILKLSGGLEHLRVSSIKK